MHFTINTDDGLRLYAELFGYELELTRHSCPNCEPECYPSTPQGARYALLERHGMEYDEGVIRCAACKETLINEINRPVDEGDLAFLEDVHVCTSKTEETSEVE